MKVVINDNYGGFSLSKRACERLVELGYPLTRYGTPREADRTMVEGLVRLQGHDFKEHREVPRNDERLVWVVEELGKAANGCCASLRVIEIPDGVEFSIEEYDGNEHVAEVHRTWR